jgi:hypothetical protein
MSQEKYIGWTFKSLYRSCAILCSGSFVYAPVHRGERLAEIVEPAVRLRGQH